jgi:hypothetical protein
MGKGGGKCASRERSGSSVASRTPRLPAKPHHVTPHQSSAKAKDVDRAADTDSATLEPFIPKVCLSLFCDSFLVVSKTLLCGYGALAVLCSVVGLVAFDDLAKSAVCWPGSIYRAHPNYNLGLGFAQIKVDVKGISDLIMSWVTKFPLNHPWMCNSSFRSSTLIPWRHPWPPLHILCFFLLLFMVLTR